MRARNPLVTKIAVECAAIWGAGPRAVGGVDFRAPSVRYSLSPNVEALDWFPRNGPRMSASATAVPCFSLHLPSTAAPAPLHCEAARWSPASERAQTLAAMAFGCARAASCHAVCLLLELCCLGLRCPSMQRGWRVQRQRSPFMPCPRPTVGN